MFATPAMNPSSFASTPSAAADATTPAADARAQPAPYADASSRTEAANGPAYVIELRD
jgi:hypothetical protein